MSIDSENNSTAAEAPATKGPRKASEKAKPAKKAGRAKKPAGQLKAERANKKAEVIAMMKRAKGATLVAIMKATGWQVRSIRGFLRGTPSHEKRVGLALEPDKREDGERLCKIAR